MNKVTVDKDRLLAKLKENREKHVREYDEAMVGWANEIAVAVLAIDKLAKRGDAEGAVREMHKAIALPKPQSYEQEYVQAIAMLEWAQEEAIDMTQEEVNKYIRDEWSWSDRFLSSTQAYNRR